VFCVEDFWDEMRSYTGVHLDNDLACAIIMSIDEDISQRKSVDAVDLTVWKPVTQSHA
jgi:hypothetical protein